MIFTRDGPMDIERWIENTGERRVRKPTSVVRRRAGGEGLCKQYLACCLSYFVVLDEELQTIEQAKEIISEWLKDMGLELKPSKTHITHTLQQYQGTIGFDFLGWTVRQFPVGRTHTGTDRWGNALGFKTIISPSQEAVKRHTQELKLLIRKHIHAP